MSAYNFVHSEGDTGSPRQTMTKRFAKGMVDAVSPQLMLVLPCAQATTNAQS